MWGGKINETKNTKSVCVRGLRERGECGSGGGNFRIELIDKLIARTRVSIIINSFLIFSSFLLYSIDISTIFSTQSILIAFGVTISQ